MSGPNSFPRVLRELRAQQIAQRHRAPALLDDADGLRRRELPRGPPGQPAQRLPYALDRAQVRTGADHHLRPGRAQPPYRPGEVPHRAGRRHPVGDVIGADHDHADVRHPAGIREHQRHLPVQVVRTRPRLRDRPQPHRPLRHRREPRRQQRARRLPGPVDALPGGRGVAQHHQPQRGITGRGQGAAVQPLRVRHPGRRAHAHPAPGQLHLRHHQTDRRRSRQPDTAAAVRRAGRDPPGHPRPRHARHASPPPPPTRTPTPCPVRTVAQSQHRVNDLHGAPAGPQAIGWRDRYRPFFCGIRRPRCNSTTR
ncbi:hypothetical protein RKD33_003343 [Streptomyces sp. SAI-129]